MRLRRFLFVVALLSFCASSSFADTKDKHLWRLDVWLSNQYVENIDLNTPIDLRALGNDWLFLPAHSYKIDLDKEAIRIKLYDMGYGQLDDVALPAFGIKDGTTIEIELVSWHTVYVSERAKDGKTYETLYGLTSSDGGRTHQWRVLVPKRIAKE